MQVVAIVGRPNVGKSTLFNRIIQKREAIIESHPGVTRDRIYAEAEWAGRYFTLVDTGGISPDTGGAFDKIIAEQANLAIDEADVILFLVDVKDGVTTWDYNIAKMLRASKKPIVLAANKCDNNVMDQDAVEFYSLGLGEVHSISALNARSTGDMLDEVISHLVPEPEPEPDERLKIAIIGRPNVGKSSITNALLGKERVIVSDIPGTTRDAIDSTLISYGKEYVLIDTAGLRKRTHVAKDSVEMYSTIRTMRAIERCDIAILVIDATQGLEEQDKKIINQIDESKKGLIIAINKWDLVDKETNTANEFALNIREDIPNFSYAPIIFISAVTKQRVTKLIEIADKIQERRTFRISTSKLNDTLLPEFERTPPPSVHNRDLRVTYASQVATAPPVFAVFCNFPALMPESYRRFIEKRIREKFDFEGVPIRVVFKGKTNPYADEG